MAKDVKNCQACEDLTEYAPEFVANGVTTTVCNSLKNNTGFNPALSKLHDDCEDLTDANDCLVGNMVDEIERFDVCDWKAYARLLVSNLYNVLGAIICSMCGVWDNIKQIWSKVNCTYTGLKKLIVVLQNSTGGQAFVRYYRDLGADSDIPYWDNITNGFQRTLNIYMNSGGASSGTQVADRDYVVMIQNCTNMRYFGDMNARITYYSSGDTRDIGVIRSHLGQHPSVSIKQYSGSSVVDSDTYFENFSWTNSGAVLIKKRRTR